MFAALHEAPLSYLLSLIILALSIAGIYKPSVVAGLQLYPYAIWRARRLHTLWSSVLVHNGWGHLLANMVFVPMYMGEVEYMLVDDFGAAPGRAILLATIFIMPMLAGLATTVEHRHDIGHRSVGASSLIFGYAVFYYCYLPLDSGMAGGPLFGQLRSYHIGFLGVVLLLGAERLKIGKAASVHLYGALAGLALSICIRPQLVSEICLHIRGRNG
ncbi:rhomboid family intramembrane serine protease [Parapedobacter sp. ISTM3]|uniref:rhomboid family intramembrane serine protease n=1 Tax=Parapedobacter sp. ISTM3 TaxID=2800130 RepID=UPI0019050D93|nr:rhomboid family intramembrane serine protease [Parapedobacter sp. ISTM3]MBK1442585.1 rhomboid family intramembrane serine protease [Parapedobacter sp. ISTM3]